MPGQNRVGRDDRSDLPQHLPPERLPFRGQPAALVVSQAHSAATGLDLLFEDAILVNQVLDDSRLLPTNPAGEGDEK